MLPFLRNSLGGRAEWQTGKGGELEPKTDVVMEKGDAVYVKGTCALSGRPKARGRAWHRPRGEELLRTQVYLHSRGRQGVVLPPG